MNKKEFCWTLVRLIGVCMVLNGFRYVLIVIENVLNIPAGPAGQAMIANSAGLLGSWCVEALIFVGVGVYLLQRGELLFNCLNSEPQ